jgi:hypothetical protein
MKISNVVVPGGIIVGSRVIGLVAFEFDIPAQFAADVLIGDAP